MKKIIISLCLAISIFFLFLKARQSPPLMKNASSFRAYLETRRPLYEKKSRRRIPSSPLDIEDTLDRPPTPTTPPPWAQSLSTRLQKSQKEDTVVQTTSEGLVALNMGEGMRYYRKVLIRFSLPHREHSFRALVHPISGEILRTWDRTHHEDPLGRKAPTLSLEGE